MLQEGRGRHYFNAGRWHLQKLFCCDLSLMLRTFNACREGAPARGHFVYLPQEWPSREAGCCQHEKRSAREFELQWLPNACRSRWLGLAVPCTPDLRARANRRLLESLPGRLKKIAHCLQERRVAPVVWTIEKPRSNLHQRGIFPHQQNRSAACAAGCLQIGWTIADHDRCAERDAQ